VLFASCRNTDWDVWVPKALFGSTGNACAQFCQSHKCLARHLCRFVRCSLHSIKAQYIQYILYRFVKCRFLPKMSTNEYIRSASAVLLLQKHSMPYRFHKHCFFSGKARIGSSNMVCIKQMPSIFCLGA